jgi:hypothetical protein
LPEHTFPWRSERDFRLWQYGAGHSQLQFRSTGFEPEQDVVRIEFAGVERVEADRVYPGPVTLDSVASRGPYPGDAKFPRLLLELTAAGRVAFVVASGVRITRETQGGEVLELLFATTKREQDEEAAGG